MVGSKAVSGAVNRLSSASPIEPVPVSTKGFNPGESEVEPPKKKFPDVRHEYLKREKANQIFAVMCEGGGLPTVLHPSFDAAAFQAARLAHENPGHRFHILASQRVSFATAPETETVSA